MMDTPTLETFNDLLAMARAETNPCRLLTVLVQAETAYRRRSDGGEQAMFDEGLLQPVMAREWPVTHDLSLAGIVATADEASHDWRFLMTAILPGKNGVAPTPGDCEPHLERMAKALMLGESLASFVFFDRAGDPAAINQSARAQR